MRFLALCNQFIPLFMLLQGTKFWDYPVFCFCDLVSASDDFIQCVLILCFIIVWYDGGMCLFYDLSNNNLKNWLECFKFNCFYNYWWCVQTTTMSPLHGSHSWNTMWVCYYSWQCIIIAKQHMALAVYHICALWIGLVVWPPTVLDLKTHACSG